MKPYARYVPIALTAGAFVAAYLFGLKDYMTIETLRTHQHMLEAIIRDHYSASIIVFTLTYVAVVALSIPGALIMTLAGGFLLGQIMGTLTSVVGATVGACLFFISVQLASKDMTLQAGPWVEKMKRGFEENAMSYLLTLRLIPIFPFVAINLVAAFLRIPLRTFFIGTLVGIVPGSFVYVSLGVALHGLAQQTPKVDTTTLWALSGLGILSLLPVLYKKIRKKSTNP